MLKLRDRVGEFGGAGNHRGGPVAADGVDQIVVVQLAAACEFDAALRCVDACHRVDGQADAVAQDL
jgi:hypothetical protein